MTKAVEFAPRVGDDELAELRARLRWTRWPEAVDGAGWGGWGAGVDLEYLRELCGYWADGFDWRAQEDALNRLPRHLVEVGGMRIHVVHARAREPRGDRRRPLLLCHGWPDSFWRYTKVIEPLAEAGYDVIVPDMPGFGYSQAPRDRVLDSIGVADLWAGLMTTLGYDRFWVAGGDIGSHVARYLAVNHPERVVAVHRMDGGLPPATLDPAGLSGPEREWVARVASWGAEEGAYAAMHRTKPDTAAVGLTDSPAGVAAWIVEKLHAWSDLGDGGLEGVYTRDEIVTAVGIYWHTGTIGSSMRMYRANAAIPPAQLLRRVEVPSGFSLYPGDIAVAPREWLERVANVVSITHPERGGHFAPFEAPESYVHELTSFFDGVGDG
jgi:pimeloyl-ACP methyl ester carboxylesterase